MQIKVYSKVEICELLGITEAEFRHAKEALKFEHSEKIDGYLYYSERVLEEIKKHRENMGQPCKGQTLDLFTEKRITLEDIDKRLARIEQAINAQAIWLVNNVKNKPLEFTATYRKDSGVVGGF